MSLSFVYLRMNLPALGIGCCISVFNLFHVCLLFHLLDSSKPEIYFIIQRLRHQELLERAVLEALTLERGSEIVEQIALFVGGMVRVCYTLQLSLKLNLQNSRLSLSSSGVTDEPYYAQLG